MIFANEFQEKVAEFQKQGYAIVPIPVDRRRLKKRAGLIRFLVGLEKLIVKIIL